MARNQLFAAPPYEVERALRQLGQNLRQARIRRNVSLEEMAAKIGVHRHALADAEKGKATSGVAIYVALLWAMGMVEQVSSLADPHQDEEGMLLARAREPGRASPKRGLDNDF